MTVRRVRAFTLIELLVVIAIIAVLIALNDGPAVQAARGGGLVESSASIISSRSGWLCTTTTT